MGLLLGRLCADMEMGADGGPLGGPGAGPRG